MMFKKLAVPELVLRAWAIGGILAVSLSSGCSERRQALGGGALTPVRVTILTEGTSSADAASGESDAAPVTVAGYGTLRGRVVVKGTVPQLAPLVAQGTPMKDMVCSLKPVPNESVEVGADGGLANVFVYLKRAPRVEIPPAPAEPVVLDQSGCKFTPHAWIIRVGQPLNMVNSDPVAHNVKIGGAIGFNQTLGAKDTKGLEIVPRLAERLPIPVQCDFHGWMSAKMLPVDHPWAAVTGPDGSFEIQGVPAGKMEFVVWHEKADYVERSFAIDIPVDGVAEHTFEVDASKLQ